MIDELTPRFVEFIPAQVERGVLYVSMTYATTTHICACGCANKVTLPLSPAEWSLCFDGEAVSLSPSVGNWEYPCKSHYWIERNEVRWAGTWTDRQVERGRARDQAELDQLFARQPSAPLVPSRVSKGRWWRLRRPR